MPGRVTKVLSAAVLILAIAVVPALAGCSGGGAEAQQVVVGFLGDFTGPSAATCKELHKGMLDYLTDMEANNPIPNTKIKLEFYDSRLDYARIKPGYVQLRSKGSQVILNYNAMYTPMLMADHQADKIPSFCFNTTPSTMGQDYMYSFSVDYDTEGHALAEWLTEQAAEFDAPMKVGYIATAGLDSNKTMGDPIQAAANNAANNFTLNWQAGTSTTTQWSTECNKLMGSDVIVVNLVGPSMSTFLSQMLERGYTGKFIGTTISFMGFWSLVRQSINDLSKLDGAQAIHAQMLWTDDTDFMDTIADSVERNRPTEAAELKKGTSYPSGHLFMMIIAEAIRLAEKTVGAENIDSVALNDALKALELDVDGWGEKWEAHAGNNIMHRTFRIIEYRAADDEWYQSEPWFLPESMQ